MFKWTVPKSNNAKRFNLSQTKWKYILLIGQVFLVLLSNPSRMKERKKEKQQIIIKYIRILCIFLITKWIHAHSRDNSTRSLRLIWWFEYGTA